MKTRKEIDKAYYESNKEKISKQQKQHYLENKDKYIIKNKNAYQKQTEEQKQKRVQATKNYIENNKELVKAKNLEYYYKNKNKILEKQTKYSLNKYNTNPIYKLRVVLSSTISRRLKKVNANKSKSSIEVVGLENWSLLKEHIEKQWIDGMDWNNYGNKNGCWSIDHIIPISSAQTEEDVYKLNHYTNLRPMWHVDNIKKSNKNI
jgi:hypothetical protein